jgi:phosphatidylinositol glycan class U
MHITFKIFCSKGVYMKNQLGQSPYDGNIFHEIPIMLHAYAIIHKLFDVNFLFILVDILNAILLCKISDKMFLFMEVYEIKNFKMKKYEKFFDNAKIKPSKFLISSFDNEYKSELTLMVYCLNPLMIMCCVAKCTVVMHNFVLCLWLYFLLADRYHTSIMCLALHTHINVYSVMLIIPTVAYVFAKKRQTDEKFDFNFKLFYYISFFTFSLATLFLANFVLNGLNWNFVKSTYVFIFEADDLQPNMGLFWYFFTEMFDHFRLFFTYVFQLNVFIYVIPLAMRLWDSPVIFIYVQVGLIAIFKSYPSFGDSGLYLSLLPTFIYLLKFMRNILIYTCMILCSIVLAPIMWHLWLSSGSGNANFYFAITLVYSIGQIFFLIDIVYAHLKREFILLNGPSIPVCEDGKKANLVID